MVNRILLKTSFLNAIAVSTKLLVGLFLNKVLAVYVGPAGYALVGQFQNAITMITTFASGAINNGVVKYTAEYHYNEQQQIRIWQTAARIAFGCVLLFGFIIVLFNRHLAKFFLKGAEYGSIFIWFASFLLFFVLNSLLLAILNGKKDIGRYVLANIFSSLVMAAVTSALTKWAGLYGALLALSINQSISFIATLFLCRRASWFRLRNFLGRYDPAAARKLGRFTLMALTSSIAAPVSQILIRNHLGQTFGWDTAGYWQGIWKISEMYLMLITTTLSVYFLPRISEIRESIELKKEIIAGYKLILPVTCIGALLIFCFKDVIISKLFTSHFAPMRELFAWQLIGDVLKMGSWLVSFIMVGKAMTKLFITTELIFSALFVVLSIILSNSIGVKGVVLSYMLTYLFYWILLLMLIFKKL